MHTVKPIRLKGNALIEFAMALPILITIIAGMIDLSFLFYDKAVITNASREGARYGVVIRSPTYASTSAIQTYTQSYCANHLISFAAVPPTASVTATPSVTPPVPGATLTVTVTYTYTDLLLHHFFTHSNLYNLTATTKMAYE